MPLDISNGGNKEGFLQRSSYDTAQLYANSQKINGLSKFHKILPMCFVCNFQERRSFPWPLVLIYISPPVTTSAIFLEKYLCYLPHTKTCQCWGVMLTQKLLKVTECGVCSSSSKYLSSQTELILDRFLLSCDCEGCARELNFHQESSPTSLISCYFCLDGLGSDDIFFILNTFNKLLEEQWRIIKSIVK